MTSIAHWNDGRRWAVNNGNGWVKTAARLEAVVGDDLKAWQPGQDFSFTTRTCDQVDAAPWPADPRELLRATPGGSILIFAPLDQTRDAWFIVSRSGAGASSYDRATKFRQGSLQDQVLAYFERLGWQNFQGGDPSHPRELLVRNSLFIRDLMPSVHYVDTRNEAPVRPKAVEHDAVQIQAGAGRFIESMS